MLHCKPVNFDGYTNEVMVIPMKCYVNKVLVGDKVQVTFIVGVIF